MSTPKFDLTETCSKVFKWSNVPVPADFYTMTDIIKMERVIKLLKELIDSNTTGVVQKAALTRCLTAVTNLHEFESDRDAYIDRLFRIAKSK